MPCKHCGSTEYGSDIFEDVCTFCVDLEDSDAVYQQYKKAGYYDQIECQHCHKTQDRYLHLAHESICKSKKEKSEHI